MRDIAANPATMTSGDPALERMSVWITYGLAEAWVERCLLPLTQRYHTQLNRGESPESLQALTHGDGDWEILFMGGNSAPMLGGGSLQALIGEISLVRSLDCIVAVAPDSSPERRLSLLEAGAVEVLGLDADAGQVERTLNRLITIVQTRRNQIDQDKLRLIGQLAVSVNHEINNPLTGLMGTAELLLLEDKNLGDKARRDLHTIIKQCHRIQEVTARLKSLNHLRTVPYGSHDRMIDLIGEMQPTPATQTPPPTEQFLPAPKILVVDDNPLIIDLISRLFEQRFAISAAGCASDALSKVERSGYDLILIDLILPEMNGLELFRAIRRLRPNQKALLMTAYEGDARVEQAIAEGALGCIFKPFQLEDLESALTEAIRTRNI